MIYQDTNSLMIFIEQIMLAKGISQTQLAAMLNKTPRAISATLGRGNVTLKTLHEICQALNCELEINLIEKHHVIEPEDESSYVGFAAHGRTVHVKKEDVDALMRSAEKAPNDAHNKGKL